MIPHTVSRQYSCMIPFGTPIFVRLGWENVGFGHICVIEKRFEVLTMTIGILDICVCLGVSGGGGRTGFRKGGCRGSRVEGVPTPLHTPATL